MRLRLLAGTIAVALAGCGGGDDEIADRVSSAAESICRSLSTDELARAFDVPPSPSEVRERVAERAVGSTVISLQTDFLTGAAAAPTKDDFRALETVANVGCRSGATELELALDAR